MKLIHRKSQLGIFVVIGMIMLAIGIYLISTQISTKKYVQLEDNFITPDSINDEFAKDTLEYIDSCIVESAKDGLNFVLLQSGYYERGDFNNTPQYRFKIKINFFTGEHNFEEFNVSLIENSVGKYIEDVIPSCVENYNNISENINKVTPGDIPLAKVFEIDSTLYVNLIYPMKIDVNKTDSAISLSKFRVSLEDTNLQRIKEDYEDKYLLHYKNYIDNVGTKNEIPALIPYQQLLKVFESREDITVEFSPISKEASIKDYRVIYTYDFGGGDLKYVYGIEFAKG